MIRRATKQKEVILKILRNTDIHPTVDWIYDEVRKVIPNISKGTVYRNLKILREDGKISELNSRGTVTRYEVNPERHYHFRCEKCGKIVDVDGPIYEELNHSLAEKTGFMVLYHRLEFYGLCHQCQLT